MPVVDTTGDALRLALAIGPEPAVAERDVSLPAGWVLTLSVLAASHRVVLRAADGTVPVAETVACAGGDVVPVCPDALPAEHRWGAAGAPEGWFRSRTARGATALRGARRAVAEAEASASPSLAVQFPGNGDAVTSLVVTAADAHRVVWTTRHLYPGPRPHVVETTTQICLPPGPAPQGGPR